MRGATDRLPNKMQIPTSGHLFLQSGLLGREPSAVVLVEAAWAGLSTGPTFPYYGQPHPEILKNLETS